MPRAQHLTAKVVHEESRCVLVSGSRPSHHGQVSGGYGWPNARICHHVSKEALVKRDPSCIANQTHGNGGLPGAEPKSAATAGKTTLQRYDFRDLFAAAALMDGSRLHTGICNLRARHCTEDIQPPGACKLLVLSVGKLMASFINNVTAETLELVHKHCHPRSAQSWR